jgi:hypothetical protein
MGAHGTCVSASRFHFELASVPQTGHSAFLNDKQRLNFLEIFAVMVNVISAGRGSTLLKVSGQALRRGFD